MAIQPIEQRLDNMSASADVDQIPVTMPDTPSMEDPAVAQDEPLQVAGVGSLLGLTGRTVGKVLEPLTAKGAKALKEPAIARPDPIAPAPVAPAVAPVAPTAIQPKTITIEPTRPVDITDVNKVVEERDRMLAEGAPQAKPPEVPISSAWTDNDGLAATINAAGERAAQQAPEMSLRSIYMQAINAGIPESFLKRALAGESMEATVGGSQLAKQIAGAVFAHDESAKILDNLMQKMSDGVLDDAGKLDLRMRLAQHDVLTKQLKGMQTDVARSLNVFKRVQDAGPGLDARATRQALDDLAVQQSDSVLYQLAVDYLDSPTRAGKNRLLEAGLGAKMRDVWFYVYQSNLLNDPQTHAYNIVGTAVFGAMAPIERTIATGVGAVRQMIPGASPDRYHLSDILAGLSGVKNGMLDGWELAVDAMKRGGESKFTDTGQKTLNPLSAENLSDTPIRLFGKEVFRTPDLNDSFIGRALDGLGFVHDMSFRGLKAGDEFIGAIVARYQLHQEAWRFSNTEYDRLLAAGMTADGAALEVNAKVAQLLTERPAQMQASIEGMRNMVTLQEKIAKEGVLGETYWWSNQILNLAPAKIFVPFSKTITNLFIEGSTYVPVLNLLSPRFYNMWEQGGKTRDVAIARLAMGGSAITGAAFMALDNRMTGSGPSQTEDRKALEAMGWQQHSFVFDKGEISEQNIEELKKITNVSVGPDKIYVSYARFDPISMVLAVGSDMADAAKFDRHPDRTPYEQMAFAGMVGVGEYIGNLPFMQGVGELLSIARSRTTDTGDKIVEIMGAINKQFVNFVYTGTPGVGLTNSTLMAHIERLNNPTKSNIMSPIMDQPPFIRAFYEARQKVMSRIPGVSKGVEPLLDSLGREVTVKNRGLDYWANWNPVIQATEGTFSETDALLAELNFGIAEPSKVFDGVRLSAEQYNRFKKLYGQEILDESMNLEQRIPYEIKRAVADAEQAGEPLLTGDKQKMISMTVERYRSMAKARMIGDSEGVPVDVGMSDIKLEFQDLAAAISRKKDILRIYGK
ncbi:hypothetical protein UFOVP1025_47 [uncultured Caudovirales phage]|uniref:Large polyvalent protein associated domain-containing protein n=1 Tax=uncultured Caudovirales phage TaxID=2100421 RepID=A0A6J5PAT5_9CAUD|nr:hypothetical protein UFOVP852_40 [uncultured Caudovirales phage]CAB4172873.1 hypothetical protein UFOVP948_10 [uncultured Caudovirales phage]CAB4179219.1 hypothetical protein UFOVP1025_47 [uncultured Caudovirales phage]CAB4220022.1 hypothetical protein UFOVP1628_50 [uncultured Caudovirales phage]